MISPHWNYHVWFSSVWSASMVYQTISSPTAERSSLADSGLESASKWASTTGFRPPSTRSPTARPSARTRAWNNSSEPSATSSRTTGSNSFLRWNSHTTTQCMLRPGWHCSGPCTIVTPRCSSKHRKRHIYNQRSKRMLRSRDWQRLIRLSVRTYWKPSSSRRSTPAEMRLHSTVETSFGSRPSTSGQLGHLRSSTTNGRDRTLWVKSSIGMLTN